MLSSTNGRSGRRPWTCSLCGRILVGVDEPERGWRLRDHILVDLSDGRTVRCQHREPQGRRHDPGRPLPGLLIVTQRPQDQAEEDGREQGDGVVLAEDSAAAGEGVVQELPGLLIVTQRPQDQAEEAGRGEGVGVVLAQDSAAAGEGVVQELPGLLIVTQRTTGPGRGGWPR